MYGMFSEYVLIDKGTSTVSVISIIDELTGPGFPVIIPSLTALVAFRRDPSDSGDCAVKFKFTLGESFLFEHAVQMNMADKLTARCFVKMNGIQILRPDILKVNAFVNDILIGDFQIIMQQGPIPQIVSVR